MSGAGRTSWNAIIDSGSGGVPVGHYPSSFRFVRDLRLCAPPNINTKLTGAVVTHMAVSIPNLLRVKFYGCLDMGRGPLNRVSW